MRSCLRARLHHAVCHELRHTGLTQLKPGSQIGYVWRPGSVSGACLAVRCFAGFLVKTAPARATRYANDGRKP